MIPKIRSICRNIAKDPKKIISYSLLVVGPVLPDKLYLQVKWWSVTGRTLNLRSPQGFNEKIQWLKLYNRRSEYTALADKYEVRKYVKKTIGEEYLLPLLGVWERAEDIDFKRLPDQFVLKCTHNSGGGMCLCKDKKQLNIPRVVQALNTALKKNFYRQFREWVYKDIPPRLIAEPFLIDRDSSNKLGTLIDYKFYCFNGEPKFLYVGADDVSQGKKGELALSVLDLDWKPAPFGRADHQPLAQAVDKPKQFEQMVMLARKLSRGIPFVRVDLYWVNGQILFSEMTFYPGAGYGLFSPLEWEHKIGKWLALPTGTNHER